MSKVYKLPREFGENWIKALRSGEYGQTRTQMRSTETPVACYCCLGVAAKILGLENEEMDEAVCLTDNPIFLTRYPNLVADLLIKSVSEEEGVKQLESKLMNLNDNRKLSFSQIADWIEENVEFYEPAN